MLSDTDPKAERVLIELWRQATPTQRLERTRSLTARAIALGKQALAAAHPELSARERNVRWVELQYGRDLAERYRQYLDRR